MKPDPAVLEALNLSASSTTMAPHGGGMSSASTFKLSTTLANGTKETYFLKTGRGAAAALMFEGEHASLNAIHAAVPTLCPPALAHGPLTSTPGASFLATAFLDLAAASSGGSLAAKLARLHTTPAPVPPGHAKAAFGFPVPTCCGDTAQPNGFLASWAEFYAERRLRFMAAECEGRNGRDEELRRLVEAVAGTVVPRLLGEGHLGGKTGVLPVVVHGDLWAGNKGEGVVFDPSACYAHSEYDLGIMKMFGGFGREFYKEYHELCPKTEPVDEYEDRVRLYELYHHLNHHALFGGGYRGGAVSIMKSLVKKYGKDKL